MITVSNKWQILNSSNEQYIHLQHVDHPGYITIKADDEGFVVDIWPDVGNESDASTYSMYNHLKEDGDDQPRTVPF